MNAKYRSDIVMIVIEVTGGLGNQMFGYAFARALSVEKEDRLIISSRMANNELRKYSLDKFRLSDKIAHLDNMPWIIKAVIDCKLKLDYRFNKNHSTSNLLNHIMCVTDLRDNSKYLRVPYCRGVINMYRGLFQTDRYFSGIRDYLLEDFKIKHTFSDREKSLITLIDSTESVCLHIRRGDFLTSPKHNVCTDKYYENAIKQMIQELNNPYFFVFSDDKEWVRNHYLANNFYVVDINSEDYVEMAIMSMCKNFIIPNSTFSWWAQYLCRNPNKKVIAPNVWLNGEKSMENDIIEDGWICLDPKL